MISELHLHNFKCFSDQRFHLGPLSLLAGLNGMGKSSVIQSLLLLRQSYVDGTLREGRLECAGNLVDLGTASDILFEGAKEDEIGISLRMEGASQDAEFIFVVTQDRKNAVAKDNKKIQSALNEALRDKSSALFGGEMLTDPPLSSFCYLHAERNGPRKFLPMSRGRSVMELGIRGEFVLDVLEQYQDALRLTTADARVIAGAGERLRDQVEAWLDIISPGVRLTIKSLPEADLMVSGFSFGSTGQLRSRDYRAPNVGFGLSYVLPVLVALLDAPQGGLVMIENPEAHIHPAGQTKLGELCARAASSGVQVIIETHSDHVMDGARIAVREGLLQSSNAAFHYFTRQSGETSVITPYLDAEGRLSEWPAGFFDQHRRNTGRLVRPKT
ncbi:MAG: DUF3696 domain-containing protein [Xanthobacteraceae bacterium]